MATTSTAASAYVVLTSTGPSDQIARSCFKEDGTLVLDYDLNGGLGRKHIDAGGLRGGDERL